MSQFFRNGYLLHLLSIPLLATVVSALTYSYSDIQVPGSSYTSAIGINNMGDIVGYYQSSQGQVHGFVLSNGTYTTLDFPGAIGGTFAHDINDGGAIVGNYDDGKGSHGFVFANGKYAAFNFPNAPGGTFAAGINKAGQIVGSYSSNNQMHGFELQGRTFKKIDAPNSTQTLPVGINNAGKISGTFYDAAGTHGFVLSGSSFQTIDFPGSNNTTDGAGLNDKALVVGNFKDPNLQLYQGLLTDTVRFQQLTVPGSVTTFPSDINNAKVIVGVYFNGGVNPVGFMATPAQ